MFVNQTFFEVIQKCDFVSTGVTRDFSEVYEYVAHSRRLKQARTPLSTELQINKRDQ